MKRALMYERLMLTLLSTRNFISGPVARSSTLSKEVSPNSGASEFRRLRMRLTSVQALAQTSTTSIN